MLVKAYLVQDEIKAKAGLEGGGGCWPGGGWAAGRVKALQRSWVDESSVLVFCKTIKNMY